MSFMGLVLSLSAGFGLAAIAAGLARGHPYLAALGVLLLAPGTLALWLKRAHTAPRDGPGEERLARPPVHAREPLYSRPKRVWKFPSCKCLSGAPLPPIFHSEVQDTSAEGWKVLLDAIERAEREQAEVFDPLATMTDAQIAEVVTLPPSLGRLKSVKRFVLDGSWTVRIPPQIGEMSSLEEFFPYQSYRLHWLPYELTRCPNLKLVVISRRALYGQAPQPEFFPRLQGARESTAGLDLYHLDPTA